MSNVVDPNDYETETLMNLTTYPFIMGTNSSLMTRFGLIVNYSMIFSAEPGKLHDYAKIGEIFDKTAYRVIFQIIFSLYEV